MPKNVDQEEIHKFDKIAAQWWDTTGPMQPLHALNPTRIDYIKQFTTVTNKRILDVGCGGGILSEALAKDGAIVTGIDLSQDVLNAAREHAKKQQINVEYQQVHTHNFAQTNQNTFDVVTCLEMLEHVPDPAAIVEDCQTLVKPGGLIFFSTINRNPKSFLLAIAGAEYVLRLLPRGTHEYNKFIRPSELNQAADKVNLELLDMTGLHYNPLTKRFKLQKNLDVNYFACYKKP